MASLYWCRTRGNGLTQGEDGKRAAAEEEHHVSQETIIGFGVVSTLMALSGIGLAWLIYCARRPSCSGRARLGALSLPARQVALG